MAVDWAQLPPELIETISNRHKTFTDFLNSRSVCRNWRSSIPKTPFHLPPQLPWLLLPQSLKSPFFDLSANKCHLLHLPESSHRHRFSGSSHGWLVILDETPAILLLNPISRATASLPPLSTFPGVISFNYADIGREYAVQFPQSVRFTCSLRQMRDYFVKKVVLSSSPGTDRGFIAMAILNPTSDLAYCRNGDRSWSIIENGRSFCEDVIYSNGSFFAVNKLGQISVFDFNFDEPKVSIIETPNQIGVDIQYLVCCIVSRYLDDYVEYEISDFQRPLIYRTARFEVFRLDWEESQWIRVQSLGDYALFIGQNSSSSFLSTDFPGCLGNCVYFTDEYSDANYDGYFAEYDLGIFKLFDGSIEPLSSYPRASKLPPPIWVSPNPC